MAIWQLQRCKEIWNFAAAALELGTRQSNEISRDAQTNIASRNWFHFSLTNRELRNCQIKFDGEKLPEG